MAFVEVRDAMLLHRLVSHEGAAVVQGVLLDREHVHRWITEVARRHAQEEAMPQVVEEDEHVACGVRRPASSIVRGVELCYPEAAVVRATARIESDFALQVGALAGLLLMVVLVAVLLDWTARRAEALSEQKSDFVAAVSHELRTPLTTIRMHAEMLRDGMVGEDRRERVHDDLVRESVRLSRLVDNVLELSRIEQGRRPLRLSEGDLAALARRVLDEQAPLLERRSVHATGPAPNRSVVLSFDAQAVEQILVNLLENAAKHGRGAEAGVVEIDVRTEGEVAVLSVADRGPGIPASERERVFDRFHRVVREDTSHVPGTGIGLSLVRDLARAHGGDAEVRARADGTGVEVRVTLPLNV